MGCIFECPNNGIAASTWEFDMHIGVDVSDCAQGLCKHCKRVCAECWLWEKSLLLHIIFQPALEACQTWCSTNRTFILAALLFLIVHDASLHGWSSNDKWSSDVVQIPNTWHHESQPAKGSSQIKETKLGCRWWTGKKQSSGSITQTSVVWMKTVETRVVKTRNSVWCFTRE